MESYLPKAELHALLEAVEHGNADVIDAAVARAREQLAGESKPSQLEQFVREHGPLLLEALDSHLYWQVNEDQSRRNDGYLLDPLTEDEQHVTDVEAKLRELLGNPVAA